jgi:hypothetical protein
MVLKVVDINPKDTETLECIIKYLQEAKSFIAISIGEDGRHREHFFNITPEQRIYLCEVSKYSAVDDFRE